MTGDTGAIPYGVGSFASRVTANAGPAILEAGGALRQKILAVAAHLLEAAAADLEIVDGAVRVRGLPDRGVPLAQVARLGNGGVAFGMVMPGGLAVGLEASAYFTPSQAGYSASAHVCILDVDPETGEVDDRPLRRRPRLRQRHQPAPRRGPDPGRRGPRPLATPSTRRRSTTSRARTWPASFLDYPLPSAREMPRIELFHLTTPSPINPARRQGRGRGRHAPRPRRGGRRRRGRAAPLRRARQSHAAQPRAHQRPDPPRVTGAACRSTAPLPGCRASPSRALSKAWRGSEADLAYDRKNARRPRDYAGADGQLQRLGQRAVELGDLGRGQRGDELGQLGFEHEHQEVATDRGLMGQPVIGPEDHLGGQPEHLAVHRSADHRGYVFMPRNEAPRHDNIEAGLVSALRDALCGPVDLASGHGRACSLIRAAVSRASRLRCSLRMRPSCASTS